MSKVDVNLKDLKFGIEIEMSSDFVDVKNILLEEKLFDKHEIRIIHNDRQSDGKKWELKTDGSTGCEITTPILTIKSDELKKLKKLFKILIKHKVEVTDKDSIHVHVDCGEIDQINLIVGWLRIENSIVKIIPKHRRKSKYCEKYIKAPNGYRMIAEYLSKSMDSLTDHYSDFSFTDYDDRKTVEFRMFEGSLNYNDIFNWVTLCLNIVKHCGRIENVLEEMYQTTITDITKMIEYLDIRSGNLIQWIYDRNDVCNSVKKKETKYYLDLVPVTTTPDPCDETINGLTRGSILSLMNNWTFEYSDNYATG